VDSLAAAAGVGSCGEDKGIRTAASRAMVNMVARVATANSRSLRDNLVTDRPSASTADYTVFTPK
jgi:hypothetical protein